MIPCEWFPLRGRRADGESAGLLDFMTGRPTGRLLVYDPEAGPHSGLFIPCPIIMGNFFGLEICLSAAIEF